MWGERGRTRAAAQAKHDLQPIPRSSLIHPSASCSVHALLMSCPATHWPAPHAFANCIAFDVRGHGQRQGGRVVRCGPDPWRSTRTTSTREGAAVERPARTAERTRAAMGRRAGGAGADTTGQRTGLRRDGRSIRASRERSVLMCRRGSLDRLRLILVPGLRRTRVLRVRVGSLPFPRRL